MDTKKLLTFLTLVQEKTYSRAAIQLNYAPATLVGHIRSLENELGVRLIHRRGNQSIMTKQGEAFLPYAQKILKLHQEACQHVRLETSDKQLLKVSTSQSLGQYMFGDMLREFARTQKNCALQVRLGNCAEFIEQLMADQADLCITYATESLNSATIVSVPLYEEHIYLIAHPSHPLAQKKSVSPDDLSGYRFAFVFGDCCFTVAFLNELKKHNIILEAQNFLGSVEMIKRYAMNNDGISLMTACSTKVERNAGRLVALPWVGEQLSVQAQIIYRRSDINTKGCLSHLIQFTVDYLNKKKMIG